MTSSVQMMLFAWQAVNCGICENRLMRALSLQPHSDISVELTSTIEAACLEFPSQTLHLFLRLSNTFGRRVLWDLHNLRYVVEKHRKYCSGSDKKA